MTAEQLTTIITNVLTGTGVIFFVGIVIRGLKNQIDGLKTQIGTLNETIEVQKKTLEAMEARVLQTEKVGNFYKDLYEELPNQVDKWKDAYTKRQEDIVRELEEAIKQKDEKLKETAEIELEKLKLQQRAVEDIPKLREELFEIVGTLRQRLTTVNQLSAFGEPVLGDWVDKGSSFEMMMSKERAVYLLLSNLTVDDRKSAAAVWRFLDAGSKPATLKEIASKLNLYEYLVSGLLDVLTQRKLVRQHPDSGDGMTYSSLPPPPHTDGANFTFEKSLKGKENKA